MYRTIFLLIIFCFYQRLFSQKDELRMPPYPSYEKVTKFFMEKYNLEETGTYENYYFAKKPDGWHLIKMHYQTKEIVQDELFWSRNNGSYLKLQEKVSKGINNRNGLVNRIMNDHLAKYYSQIIPYWGYPGWEKDVINEFGNKKNLSDSLLNGLARAYSSLSRNLIVDEQFTDLRYHYELPKGQNALTDNQLKELLHYGNLAIETYKKLWDKNPDFENIVTNAENMYANEIVTSYFNLRCYQNEKVALEQLKPGLYDEFVLEMARNYLNSCDKNAILFVNGDADTFPLLYVQAVENFRKDVLVVNLAFLNLGRYINHLANYKGGAEPLKLSIDSSRYKNDEFSVFYITNKIKKASLKKVIAFVASSDKATQIIKHDGNYVDYIPTKNITVVINEDVVKEFDPQQYDKIDTALYIKLRGSYVFLSQFCVLDIINVNAFKRPIYFASTIGRDNYLGMENYLQHQGMAYKLVPFELQDLAKYPPSLHINPDVLYMKLTHDLKFEAFNKHQIKPYSSIKKIINLYRKMFGDLAIELFREEKEDLAVEVLDKNLAYFPFEIIKPNYFSINHIEGYFKARQPEKANAIASIYFDEIIRRYNVSKLAEKEEGNEQKICVKELHELNQIMRKYLRKDELSKKIEIEFERLYKIMSK